MIKKTVKFILLVFILGIFLHIFRRCGSVRRYRDMTCLPI